MQPDELDFLTDTTDAGALTSAALDHVREPLVEWTAGALLARHPQARAWRGPRGLAAARQDAGFHVRHLQAALESGDATGLRDYAAWWLQVLAQRGTGPGDPVAAARVLDEALRRFLSAGSAALATQAWQTALAALEVASPPPAR